MALSVKQMAKKLKGAVTSPTAKKIGVGLGIATGTAVAGYGLYKGIKALKGTKSRRSTLARVRTRRKIWQEKTKLERAKKAYERITSQ